MILLLDTSIATCKLSLVDKGVKHDDEWLAGRQLARDLLTYLRDQLGKYQRGWDDIDGIGVYEGPGSFTGLRIGLTVLNTIADTKKIPIVGARGDNWQQEALRRLGDGEDQKIVLPFYGSDAKITTPKK